MGLTIRHLITVHQNLKIKGQPVSFLALVLTMNISIAKKLIIEYIGTIFFLDLFLDHIFNFFTELNPAAANIPAAMLIAGIWAAFGHNKVTFAVMAEVNHCNPNVINAFSHYAP